MACDDYVSPQDMKDTLGHTVFVAEIANSTAGGVAGGTPIDTATNSVTGKVANTVDGQFKKMGGIALNGGVWAAGQTFTSYTEYMIYNGVAYKPLDTTVLPYGPTAATPDTNFVGPYDSGASIVNVSTSIVLGAGQTTVASVQDLDQSTVYLSGPNIDRGRLKDVDDYTKTTSFQLELKETYPAGSKLEIVTRDIEEAITLPDISTYSLTESELISSAVANIGDSVTVPEKGNAKYTINDSSYTLLVGDIELASGLKAALQAGQDGAWNVLWFDADPTQNNQYLTFDLAAQRALQAMSVSAGGTNTRGPVRVPAQNWTLGQQVPTEAIWYLDPGAELTEPTNYLPSNTDNLEYLKGEVIKIGARGFNVLQVGDPDLDWLANNWRASAMGTAAIFAASSQGAVGLTVCTRSSDNPSGGEGTIGVQSYVANDNQTNIGNTYNYFGATYKLPNAGTTFNTETNVTTIGDFVPVFPYGDYGGSAGITVNHWVGGPEGGTVGGFEDAAKRATSAGMVFSPGLAVNPNNSLKWGFDAGIVFLKVAFNNGSQDVIRSFTGSRFQYWTESGGDSVVRLVGEEDEASSGSGKYEVQIRDVTDASLINYRYYRDKFFTTDNKADLGIALNRWITGYFYNSPDVVSDRTKKTDEETLTANEHAAAMQIARSVKRWKWIAEKEQKAGTDKTVYWHIGPMAQDVWQALLDHGLDPTQYGFINRDDDGENYSIIKDELLWWITAAMAGA